MKLSGDLVVIVRDKIDPMPLSWPGSTYLRPSCASRSEAPRFLYGIAMMDEKKDTSWKRYCPHYECPRYKGKNINCDYIVGTL